jgi:SAM-dependent methyltransferase
VSTAHLRPEPERSTSQIEEYLAWQAARTRPLRRYLYRKVGLRQRRSILDAGCGTGIITREIARGTGGHVRGVDIDEAMVSRASAACVEVEFIQADVGDLPFDDASFDLVVSHFLFMWVRDQGRALAEMVRVLEPGGVVLACVEPDYGGRLEFPENLLLSGALLQALHAGGADPCLGRRLGTLFRGAGLDVETGVTATVMQGDELASGFEIQRSIYARELAQVLEEAEATAALEIEASQVRAGKMTMVPLFWAIGTK